MILLGCLLAFGAAVAPRAVLILAWIFSDRWPLVWQGDWILPLLGIILLPYTTIMYLLSVVVLPGGETSIETFGWLWILLGLFLDLWKWSQVIANRKQATAQVMTFYPAGAPGYSSVEVDEAAISSGQVPMSTSPTASDDRYEPEEATTPSEVPGDDRPKS